MIVSSFGPAFLLLSVLMVRPWLPEQTAAPSDFALGKALPQEISGWQKAGMTRSSAARISSITSTARGALPAFDFRFVFVREYAKAEAPAVVVEIYQMSSSADAFGIFTQDPDGQPVRVGQEALYGAGLLRFWKDDVFGPGQWGRPGDSEARE